MNSQKLINMAIVMGAGFAATKVISLAWKGITGHEPPKEIDADDGSVSVTEVVIFAAVSSATAALVKAYASKGAKRLTARPATR